VEEDDMGGSPGYSEIIQENHYYPFGLNMTGPWDSPQWQPGNAYQYNGKEWNEDLGLDLYDYGARWYDAAVGRWGQMDPLAEKYAGWSAYNYVMGNPLLLIDPYGMASSTYDPQDLEREKQQEGAERMQRLREEMDSGPPGGGDPPFQVTGPVVEVTAKRPATIKGDYLKVGDVFYPKKMIFVIASYNESFGNKFLKGQFGTELAQEFNKYLVSTKMNEVAMATVKVQLFVLTSFVPIDEILWAGVLGRGSIAAKGGFIAIQAGKYTITKTVAKNLSTRPYLNSP
jgi:RHS repeat-associated protein